MPAFGLPFSGLAYDRKLTDNELIKAIRFTVAAEYDATQLYMRLAESTDNKFAVKVLKDVADEERVHVGEFLRLLCEPAPDVEEFYAKGTKRKTSQNRRGLILPVEFSDFVPSESWPDPKYSDSWQQKK